MRKLRKNPIFSLEYIVSKGYDGINITHLLLLLLYATVKQKHRSSCCVAFKAIERKEKLRYNNTEKTKRDKEY